jgi:hypothetical protein
MRYRTFGNTGLRVGFQSASISEASGWVFGAAQAS